MAKLSDTQAILLSAAAQRDSGSLLPLPTTITAPPAAVARSLASLVKRGLAEERAAGAPDEIHSREGDLSYGLYVTAAGRAAVGVEAPTIKPAPTEVAEPVRSAPPRQTKAALVIDLLRRDGGATLAELVEATGWLPHTTRAALTGLRKKGHAVERMTRGDATCYRLGGAA